LLRRSVRIISSPVAAPEGTYQPLPFASSSKIPQPVVAQAVFPPSDKYPSGSAAPAVITTKPQEQQEEEDRQAIMAVKEKEEKDKASKEDDDDEDGKNNGGGGGGGGGGVGVWPPRQVIQASSGSVVVPKHKMEGGASTHGAGGGVRPSRHYADSAHFFIHE
jgi:hypothetical protein